MSEQQQVLDCLKEIGPCGFRTVAKTLDMDDDHVKELMESLQTDGYIKKQSNKQWVALKTKKPKPDHAWRQPVVNNIKSPQKLAAEPQADNATVEFYVRLCKGIWPAPADGRVNGWKANSEILNTDGVKIGALICESQFTQVVKRLHAEWFEEYRNREIKLDFNEWLYNGILKESAPAQRQTNDTTVEFYVRLRRGVWNSDTDIAFDWAVNVEKFKTDNVDIGFPLHKDHFDNCVERLRAEWKAIFQNKSQPYPSFQDWLYNGILKEREFEPNDPTTNEPDPALESLSGPTMRDLIDSGHLSDYTLDTATTDDLIEQVRLGREAAEIIRKRLAEVGL